MRILIVSYYFPPYMNVGGLRALSWARVFHDAGHDVTVIHGDGQEADSCAYFPQDLGRDVKALSIHNPRMGKAGGNAGAPDRGKKFLARLGNRARKALKPWIPMLDLFGTWALAAGATLEAEIAKEGAYDAIVSTSFPLSAHRIARRIKDVHGGIWIADFRDFFGQFESTKLAGLSPRTWRLKSFARLVGKEADLVTTVSGELEELLHGFMPKARIDVYFNGYFEEHLPKDPPAAIRRRILYTGSYNAKEFTIQPLIEALGILAGQGYELPVLTFAGGRIESLATQLEAAGLPHEFLPSLPNRDILRLQAESAILLLCDAMSGPGVLLTKTFEYLAARRPILVITKRGSELATTLFAKPSSSYLLSTEPGEIAEFIRRKLEGGQEDFLAPEIVRQYSREAQAERLLGTIAEMVGWRA